MITQHPCTLEDMKKTEQRAMKKYLSKFDVVDQLPAISDIQVGSVAPFYKLNSEGTVYMQVVRIGSAPAASEAGFSSEISSVIPFLYNIRYFNYQQKFF